MCLPGLRLAPVSANTERLTLAEAVAILQDAGSSNSICLGAKGFWLSETGNVEPSIDHILDLSSVTGRSPRTNASLALAVIEKWPEGPSRFAVELVMTPDAYPCPCCGHLTLSEPPGSYEICVVCFWEDDAVQLRWPTYEGGANSPSLIDSQRAYAEQGAMEYRFTELVRPATEGEPRDTAWRPIDPERDSFEVRGEREADWPTDLTTLYWWRPKFWRAGLAKAAPKSEAAP